ncbi:MAG: response regulator [Deltaproteobacteria bacterium]|nr:response regulator [Deltaproteobacteria bacterium]
MRILVVDDSVTVRKVIRRTLEQAGYEVADAEDGQDAFEQVQRSVPDLALVDDVMPHMGGVEFVEAMRGVSNTRHVPVVMMSARGERVGEELIRQTGALDSIAKPFGPEALLAVTAHAIDKGARSGNQEDERDTLEVAPGRFLAAAGSSEEPTTLAIEAEREASARTIAGKLTLALGDVIRRVTGSTVDDSDIAAQVAAALAPERLFRLAEEVAAQLPGEHGETSFRGRVDHINLGEVLQMMQHQRQTGVLTIRRDQSVVIICLREGLLDLAMGRGGGGEFLLGRYVLREQLVEPKELERLLQRRGGQRHLLGAQLVKLGYLTKEDLRGVLIHQSSELIYEAMRWPDGAFGFERLATRPEATAAHLGLPVATILMEGLRRVDEWHLIQEQLHSFDLVPVVRRDVLATVSTDDLHSEERAVLAAIDGERSVRDIVETTSLSSFDVGKVLFQLVTSGIVHERH